MKAACVLSVLVLLGMLAACNSDAGSGGSSGQSAFRSLGKRADSNLGGERVGTSVR
jgi:hypothetical protein